MNVKDHFLIDLDVDTSLSLTHEDVRILEGMQLRQIGCYGEINDEMAADITDLIIRYNIIDKGIPAEERKPIHLYIDSPGGSVTAGYSILDAIDASKTPVYTINSGTWYSMGLIIGMCGHKRFAFPNASFLQHEGFATSGGSVSGVYSTAEFIKKTEDRIKALILEKTNISEEEYDKKNHLEWYMYPEEAKEKGFIDYIIGKDCTLDDIL